MTYDEFMKVITNDVSRIIGNNMKNAFDFLVSDLDSSQSITENELKLCKNAVTVSVQLSVQIMFDYLNSLGMLNYENLEEHHEPPVLTVLSGGLDKPNN